MKRIAQLEAASGGKPLREVVIDAVSGSPSIAEAARKLGINKATLRGWLDDLDIQYEIRREVVILNPILVKAS